MGILDIVNRFFSEEEKDDFNNTVMKRFEDNGLKEKDYSDPNFKLFVFEILGSERYTEEEKKILTNKDLTWEKAMILREGILLGVDVSQIPTNIPSKYMQNIINLKFLDTNSNKILKGNS